MPAGKQLTATQRYMKLTARLVDRTLMASTLQWRVTVHTDVRLSLQQDGASYDPPPPSHLSSFRTTCWDTS